MLKDTEVKIWTSERPLFLKNKAALEDQLLISVDRPVPRSRWHEYVLNRFKSVRLDIRPDRRFDEEFADELLAFSRQQEDSSIPTVNVIILGTEDALLETLNPTTPVTSPDGPSQGSGVDKIIKKIITENQLLQGIGNLIVGPFPMNLAVPESLGRVPIQDYDKTYRSWSEQWDTLVSSSHNPDDPSTWSTLYADPTEWFCRFEEGDLVLDDTCHEADGVALTAKAIHYLLEEVYEMVTMLARRNTARAALFAFLQDKGTVSRLENSTTRVHWRREKEGRQLSSLQDGKKEASSDPQDQKTDKKTKEALPKLKIRSITSCDCDGKCRKQYGIVPPASPEKN